MSLRPRPSAPYVFAFLLSGIATFMALGASPPFVPLWARSWITAWVIAFPVLLVIRPLVHRRVERLTG